MIKNYLKIALRTLQKYKGYTIINVFGLAVGLASAILILLYVQDELSYDKHHEKLERIYRVTLQGKFRGERMNYAISSFPIGPTLKDEFPSVKEAVRIQPQGKSEMKLQNRKYIEDHLLLADSTVFDVFTIPMLKGKKKQALSEPNKVVLTESIARKYFGDEDPMGKTIHWNDHNLELEVSGIVKDCPETSHFQYDLLVSFVTSSRVNNTMWLSNVLYTYVVLQEGISAEKVESQFPAMVEKYVGPQVEQAFGVSMDEFRESGNEWGYNLQPLQDIYLHSDQDNEIGETGNINNVYFFSIIAIFLILIAAINFMNLSTAKSANRAKEVGIRKVTGGNRKQIVLQFLAEAVLITFLALILSVVLVEIALPYFNNLASKNLDIHYFQNPVVILALVGLGLLVGLLAGSYPAFYLSAYSPVAVLKGKVSKGSKNSRLRGILVVFQFVITIVLFVSTIVVSRQMHYVKNKDLGFEKNHILLVNQVNALGDNRDAFRQEILKNANVLHASYSREVPGKIRSNTAFYPEGSSSDESRVIDFTATDSHFDETYEIEMKEGRYFSEDYSTDSLGIIINEAAAQKLGYTDPVGKKLMLLQGNGEDIDFKVLGVMKNFNYRSLHHKLQPFVIYYMNDYYSTLSVKIRPEEVQQTVQFIKSKWTGFVESTPFNYSFLAEDWEAKYRSEQRVETIFRIFSLLAIMIACLGLLGLASFMAEQKTKEIGVRKVFGASVSGIIRLLSREIVLLILISTAISWPVAYYLMNSWLRDFAFKVELSLVSFAVSSILAFLIALSIVGYRTYQAATANPAESLKDE